LGVNDPKPIYGTTAGLADRFGRDRVFNTPLAEEAMTGVAVGAALGGLRPIHVHIRMDFLLLAMNQLVNVAAKSRYMYGGAVTVPMVVRAIIGRSWGQGAQHSQALHSLFMHVPGLKVVAPSTPYDAKGALVAAIRDDNPVIFVEHRLLHGVKGHVPEAPYTVPFGRARVLAEGRDVTVVAISHMTLEALRARASLERVGISAEIIDPVSLSPLDMDTIEASLRRTGRLLVVDCGWSTCGAGAEIVARAVERLADTRDLRVRRLGWAAVPCPTTRPLEDLFYPSPRKIAAAAQALVLDKPESWEPEADVTPVETEPIEFKGPF
ncbi:MAG TPA: transketolase C-terminal domain-containing protein, partial [Candidatus Limnocylindrales bacterium]|nr:transketolase C-terminal domain-containing protein [Candidatus Limnocylindrales bacterium]